MNQKVKKGISITINVVLGICMALILVTLMFSVILRIKGNSKSTWFFGLGFYQIVSGSMEPEIKVGDLIIAKSVKIEDVEIGDNLVFAYNNKIVTHKVIDKGEDFVITHGIANQNGSNEKVLAIDIIAVQIGQLKGFGNVLDFMRSGYGFILIILIPIGGIIVYQTINLKKRIKEYNSSMKEEEGMKEEIERLKEELKAKDSKDNVDRVDNNESKEIDDK